MALTAAVTLLVNGPRRQPGDDGQPPTLWQAHPQLAVYSTDGLLADGTAYQPVFFIDPQRWVAVAPTGDGAWVRLLMRTGGTEIELRRLPMQEAAEFAGFVTDGLHLAWLELTFAADGARRNRIWAVKLDAARPRLITEDTGHALIFDRQDDMVLHDGLLTWVAGTDSGQRVQIRTVALTGGKVQVRTVDGAYAFAGWPWMTSVDPRQGPVELFNLATGRRVVVRPRPGELLSCSPSWCRAVLPGIKQNSTRIELVAPDDTQRIRSASGAVAAALDDVAVLDRYEVYSTADESGSGVRLLIFDLVTRQSMLVATDVGQVRFGNKVLWWSTGERTMPGWHWISLRELASQD